jgi:hypothetical protein
MRSGWIYLAEFVTSITKRLTLCFADLLFACMVQATSKKQRITGHPQHRGLHVSIISDYERKTRPYHGGCQ